MKATTKTFWIILVILIIVLIIAAYKNYQKNQDEINKKGSISQGEINNIGRIAYANKNGVKVFTDKSLSRLYKTASSNEWVGTVQSVEDDLYKVSGNRYVKISDTYLL